MREERQEEAVNSYTGNYWSLIKAAPRFGKIKVSIEIFKKLGMKKILVCLPRVDIKNSWEDDIKKWGWDGDVTYSTFRSLHKVKDKYDIVVIDEIHECSSNQLMAIKKLKPDKLLALSGTITKKRERKIGDLADIHVCYDYSIEQAVEEGILCDYEIFIHTVPLDDKIRQYNGKTEKGKFGALVKKIEELLQEDKDTFYLYLQQIQIIQNSTSKMQKTRELLEMYDDKRILCFCGVTAIADQLDRPVYHSKNKEKGILKDFCDGKGKHLITIKMAQAGLTITPIDMGVINYTSGNPEDTAQKICRFLGLEYNNLDKKAIIHIVICDEEFERERIATSLMFFDEEKIKYIGKNY